MNAPLRFNYPPEVTLNPRIDAAELAESVAQQERQRLGLGDQPVINLRSTLEWDVGLRIFYWDLPSAIAGMYAYTADLGCCILVNRKHPPERRRVSMLHEYGHLIVDRYKPGIDYLTMTGRKPANERFAESFALSFLMPDEFRAAAVPRHRDDHRRLPSGRPAAAEPLLLRLGGGDGPAVGAVGPDSRREAGSS